jgi:hypothetical protein
VFHQGGIQLVPLQGIDKALVTLQGSRVQPVTADKGKVAVTQGDQVLADLVDAAAITTGCYILQGQGTEGD